LNVAGYSIIVFFKTLFEATYFCFSLFSNPEIEALNPEPGDQRSKPGHSGSKPEGWQP